MELDFLQEAKNTEKACLMFRHFPWLKVRKTYIFMSLFILNLFNVMSYVIAKPVNNSSITLNIFSKFLYENTAIHTNIIDVNMKIYKLFADCLTG